MTATLPLEILWRGSYLSERVAWLRHAGYPRVTAAERRAAEHQIGLLMSKDARRHWRPWLRLLGVTRDEHVAARRERPPGKGSPPAPAAWQGWLAEILSSRSLRAAVDEPSVWDQTLARPLAPFMAWAREQTRPLLAQALASGAPLDAEAFAASLWRDLGADLWACANRTLILEVNLARVRGRLRGDTPQERLTDFVDTLLRSPRRLRDLYLRYPPLARVLASICGLWVQSIRELLADFSADHAQVWARLFGGVDPGRLSRLDGAGGDSHGGGRRVRVLVLASGRKLVYKPRSLALDVAFQRWLGRVNEAGLKHPLSVFAVLDMGGHGWTEFVQADPAADRAALQRYYYRLGAYLPLLWVLRGTDFHFENVIASGEHPMLIDLELLFSNQETLRLAAEGPAQVFLRTSMLATGILPSQPVGGEGPCLDVSVLGKRNGQVWQANLERVESPQGDDVRVGRGNAVLPSTANMPTLDGRQASVLGFEDDFLQGLRDAFNLLQRRAGELLDQSGALRDLLASPLRHVLRPTIQYGTLQFQSYHPNFVTDALLREYFLGPRLAAICPFQKWMKRVVVGEFHELVARDVPRYSGLARSRDLWTADGRHLPRFFPHSAWGLCQPRRRALGSAEERRQEEVARLALTSLRSGSERAPLEQPEAARVAPAAFLAEARALGQALSESAVRLSGRADWMGLRQNVQLQANLTPLGSGLYDGGAGILLFLGYLARLDPRSDVQDVLRAGLRQVERERRATRTGAGISGTGGLAYALLHAGRLLGDESLVSAAMRSARQWDAWSRRDDSFDVVSGSAGLIAVLLALAEATRATWPLDHAVTIGRRLARRRVPAGAGCGWPTRIEASAPLTGMAHGAAGIAWALLRVEAATGERRLGNVAREALRYERGAFDAELGNWPELRAKIRPTAGGPMAWCYGLPGIGLSRLTLPGEVQDDEARRETAWIVERLTALPLSDNDSLCHGELGNADTLLVAAQQWRRPDLLRAARRRVALSLERRRRAGHWRGGFAGLRHAPPGLFVGLAGIGYQLLRAFDPERVPSVLALEPPRARGRQGRA